MEDSKDLKRDVRLSNPIFISDDVELAFKTYLGQTIAVVDEGAYLTHDFIDTTIRNFQDSLITKAWDRGDIRDEIVAGIREVIGENNTSRYTHEDIIGWVCPFPDTVPSKIVVLCVERIKACEVATKRWDLSEDNMIRLGNVLWTRVIRRVTNSDAWNLARWIHNKYHLKVNVRTLVKFILDRRVAGKELDGVKLVEQASIEFSFKI
jgi:hypothetical protein